MPLRPGSQIETATTASHKFTEVEHGVFDLHREKQIVLCTHLIASLEVPLPLHCQPLSPHPAPLSRVVRYRTVLLT
jgi:hypothetical protein